MKKILFLSSWFLFFVIYSQSWEGGIPILKNYSPIEYKAYSQNWSILENDNHLILVANGDGILLYDGINWKKIILPNYITPVSLLQDRNNLIWVGGFGEIGFLRPNIKNGYDYISLLPLIPSNYRAFDFVKEIVRTSNAVYFSAHDKIYVFDSKGLHVVLAKVRGYLCKLHDHALWLSADGIYDVRPNAMQKIQDASSWIRRISSCLNLADDTLLAWDEENGLLKITYKEKGSHFSLFVDKIMLPLEEIFLNNQIRHFIKLRIGGYAFATQRDGTYILNNQFKLITHLSRETGLINETHNFLHEDIHQNLWIAMDYGIAKINLNVPLFLFNYSKGIKGSVLDVTKINNRILAGTWQGLFYRDLEVYGQYFLQDPYLESQVWKFLKIKRNKFPYTIIASSNGLYGMDTKYNFTTIDHGSFYYLTTISEPDSMLVGANRKNIRLYSLKNLFPVEKIEVSDNIRSIAGISNRIYISTYSGKLFCFTFFKEKYKLSWTIKQLHDKSNKKDELKLFFQLGNEVILSTRTGLYFARDTILVPVFSKHNFFNKFFPTYYVAYLKYENDSSYWMQLESKEVGNRIFMRIEKKGRLYYPHVFTFFPSLEILSIYNDGDSLVWIATDEGVFCYDRRLEFKKSIAQRDEVIITCVFLNDEMIYNGVSNSSDVFLSDKIPHGKNVLRIYFTSNNFTQEDQNVFWCKLEGYDKDWVQLGRNHTKEYSQLPPGKYTFLVKSISPDGSQSLVRTMVFRIAYPWYMKWWAVVLGILLLGLLISFVTLLINRRLIQVKNRLEKQVQERTKEIELRNKELELEKEKSDFLLFNILPVKVAEELKTKGKFIPLKVTEASVVFTDFVRFSLLSEQYTSEELVEKLDFIFSRFDDICSRYQLEKIKTIGDSHMSVGGLPMFSKTHAIDAALAALEMVDFMEYLNETDPSFEPWKVRIGIHVGNLIAGIVGKRKFGFDVWGTTVNMASRLQDASLPNKINVSEKVVQRLEKFFVFTYRGKIPVKYQGEIEMYFLERLKPEYSIDPQGRRPNHQFKQKYIEMLDWKYLNF